ncbi:MAG: FAD binding domain-containing protein [Pseudomonadota bacterium]
MSDYSRPSTVSEAVAALAQGTPTIAAGCTDLFPATVAPALAGPVLDITGIAALRGITTDARGITLGATTTWTDVLRAPLPPAFDMLKEAAREVGSTQIQNAGTLAGNLCNASPAADGVPPLIALDAEVALTSTTGTRRLPLSDFLTGPRQTARRPDELLTALHIPSAATRGESRFLKLGARKYLVISIAMVAARLEVTQGRITQAALAIGSCSAVATRLPALEARLIGQRPTEIQVSDQDVAPALSPIDDIRADAAYRTHAAAELLRRALADLSRSAAA